MNDMKTCRGCLHVEACTKWKSAIRLIRCFDGIYATWCNHYAPRGEYRKVVYCYQCKYFDPFQLECNNGYINGSVKSNGFCFLGERRSGDEPV